MLMDGKELAKDIKAKIKAEIDDIKRIYNVNPTEMCIRDSCCSCKEKCCKSIFKK